MKRLSYVALVMAVVSGCCLGTFFATKHFVFKEAYGRGEAHGYAKSSEKSYSDGFSAGSKNTEICPGDPFHLYAVCPSPPQPTTPAVTSPSHCLSYTYGTSGQFTNTNCN